MNENDLCEILNFVSFRSPSKLNKQEGFVCARVFGRGGCLFFVFCLVGWFALNAQSLWSMSLEVRAGVLEEAWRHFLLLGL